MEKKDILIILSLFFVAFLIRAPGVPNVCIYGDEWLYWVDTNRILVSDFAPRAEVFDYSPPFLQHIGAVVTLFFGGDLNTLRMVSVTFGSLTVPFLYLFGKEMYDRKTGILSALFLCFSAYHCLYSRIIMLEALTLFFVTAFLYFFWLSQRSENDRKSTTYAIIAGAMMGLAFDAKYISIFLIPAVLAYVLWTKRFNFKALLDKRIILTFIFAFLFFLPLLICLSYTGVGFHGIFYYGIERFEKETAGGYRLSGLSLNEFLARGEETITGIFAWGAETLIPTLGALFKLSVILLIFITLFFYLPHFINREKEGSFLMISIFSLYMLLIGCASYKHYHIYSLLFYFTMFSHLTVKSFECREKNYYKNVLGTFIILLTAIMLFSSFFTSVTSPYWDEGEYSGTKSAMEYIKKDAAKSGYGGDVVIGTIFRKDIMDYSIYLNDLNMSTIRIIEPTTEYESEKVKIDLKKICILKPDYLVIVEHRYHRYYLKGKIEKETLKDYKIVFRFKKYFYEFLIFKKKNMQPGELLLSTNGEGEISQDMFKRSVPSVMKVGKTYTTLVQIKNTGDSCTKFTVKVVSDVPNKFIIFVEDKSRDITLDKGSTHLFKFKIVPFREYVSELPITVELYAEHEEDETYMKKVDSVTDYVYLIKR